MKVLSGMVSTIIVEDETEDVPEELTSIDQDIVLVVSFIEFLLLLLLS